MNAIIASTLKENILELNWSDRVAGLVKSLIRTDRVEVKPGSGQFVTVRKAIPISCDTTFDECKDEQKAAYLTPDKKKRAVTYFEDGGIRFIQNQGMYREWESSLQLVNWVNMDRFDFSGCFISPFLVMSIIEKLPSRAFDIPNTGICKATVTVIGEAQKNASIFSKYTYKEEISQYLLAPFDYFALNLKVNFSTPKGAGCFTEIALKDESNCPA